MARPVTKLFVLTCALASNCFLASQAQGSKDALQQSWWLQFQQKESTFNQAIPPTRSPANASVFTTRGAESSQEVLAGAVQKGYFSVPAYFGAQPQPFERPMEIVTQPRGMGWRAPLPGIGFGAPLGWGGWGGGWGAPGFAWSGVGLGLGSLGLGWGGCGSGWGTGYATRVWQTGPSKPSGNYYAPSNVDTTASGSYYATTTPSQTPMFEKPKPITNFWGSSSPYGRDSSMPWNK